MSRKRFKPRQPAQASLFHPPTRTPLWDSLPPEARTQATRLIAQMLKKYQTRERTGAGEVRDE